MLPGCGLKTRTGGSALPVLLLLSVHVCKAAQESEIHDPVAVLAKGMPIGAQKILLEKESPPAAPLRLIAFPDTGEESDAKGKGYGVDPLQMSMVRLQLRPPEERIKTEDASAGSAPETGAQSSEVSVKAIHQHVNDVVDFHGGKPDESVTPIVKPPGVHILDTVTRTLIQNVDNGFQRSIPAENPDQSLSRSIKHLDQIKVQLPDGGKDYAVPAQQLLARLRDLSLSPATAGAGVDDKIPSDTSPDMGGKVPDVAVPDTGAKIPDVAGAGVDDNIPSDTSPDMGGKVPDVAIPDTGVKIPDAAGAGVDDEIPSGTSPDIDGISSQIGEVSDGYDSSLGNRYPSLNIPAADDKYPGIDFDQIDQDLNELQSKIASSDSYEGVETKLDEKLAPVSATVSADLNAGMGALDKEVDADLDMMANKVASAVGQAFDAMQAQLNQQGADQSAKADAVNVPDKDCKLLGPCWLTGETSESKANRSAAQSQKDTYNDSAAQFYQAASEMPTKKATAQASVYSKFGAAEQSIDGALTSNIEVGSTGDTDNEATGSEPGGANRSTTSVASDNDYSAQVNDDSSVVALVTVGSGDINYSATESINAAIGDEARAEQYIAAVDTVSGDLTVKTVSIDGIDIASINAGIGYNSLALQVIDSLLDRSGEASIGSARLRTLNTGSINVSLAANSTSEMAVTSVLGSVKGNFSATSAIAAPINVTLGNNTSAVMHLGAWEGNVEGAGNLFLQSTAALSAAIGDETAALVRLASQGPGGYSTNLDISVVSEGALAAPLGYRSSAIIEMGNVDGVTGSAHVSVGTGPAISAALGSNTLAANRIANLSEGKRVGGTYRNTVNSGSLLAFAVGDNTHAINALGSVEANIGGGADITVTAGEVATGTVGERTEAETYIGSVLDDVSGNVDINVVVGAINTFSVGISSSKDIYAKTYIGNVTSKQGSVNINASSGAVFNLGFGLVIDLGALGTLDFSKQGCVKIANAGSAPC